MKKKGISPIVGWVLMLGLAISLAAVTIIYVKSTTEERVDDTVTFIESGLQCDEIFWNINYVDDMFMIKNAGGKSIKGFVVKETLKTGVVDNLDVDQIIPPGENYLFNQIPINKLLRINKIDFVPLVEIDNDKVGCNNKRIIVNEEDWT